MFPSFLPPSAASQALERQTEMSDIVRIERDRLRDEVVRLRDLLKVFRGGTPDCEVTASTCVMSSIIISVIHRLNIQYIQDKVFIVISCDTPTLYPVKTSTLFTHEFIICTCQIIICNFIMSCDSSLC